MDSSRDMSMMADRRASRDMSMMADRQRHKYGFEENETECRPWSDFLVEILDIIADLMLLTAYTFVLFVRIGDETREGSTYYETSMANGTHLGFRRKCLLLTQLLPPNCQPESSDSEQNQERSMVQSCASKYGWLLLQKFSLSFSTILLPRVTSASVELSSVPSSPNCSCFAIQKVPKAVEFLLSAEGGTPHL